MFCAKISSSRKHMTRKTSCTNYFEVSSNLRRHQHVFDVRHVYFFLLLFSRNNNNHSFYRYTCACLYENRNMFVALLSPKYLFIHTRSVQCTDQFIHQKSVRIIEIFVVLKRFPLFPTTPLILLATFAKHFRMIQKRFRNV